MNIALIIRGSKSLLLIGGAIKKSEFYTEIKDKNGFSCIQLKAFKLDDLSDDELFQAFEAVVPEKVYIIDTFMHGTVLLRQGKCEGLKSLRFESCDVMGPGFLDTFRVFVSSIISGKIYLTQLYQDSEGKKQERAKNLSSLSQKVKSYALLIRDRYKKGFKDILSGAIEGEQISESYKAIGTIDVARALLEELPLWDGKPRIDTFFHDVFNMPAYGKDSHLAVVAHYLFESMIHRMYTADETSKVDALFCFLGNQAIGKTSFLRFIIPRPPPHLRKNYKLARNNKVLTSKQQSAGIVDRDP